MARERGDGLIGWMVDHRVAPNLIMMLLLVGGLYMTTQITQEVFPDFQTDAIEVSVAYPSATPEQIEQGVVQPVEEAVRGLPGIEEVTAVAGQGSGTVTLELIEGADVQRTYQDVTRAVETIDTFPDDAEDPEIEFSGWRRDVVDFLVHGDVPEHTLRAAAETVRDELLLAPGITQAGLDDVSAYEIHVDIDESRLRAHDLTLEEVAEVVAANARDRAAGTVKTPGGDILLEVDERRVNAEAFGDITVLAGAGGSRVQLRDIATVSEAFSDQVESISTYNGEPALQLETFRVADETPIGVSEAGEAVLPDIRAELPPGIDVSVASDSSEIYQERLDLLMKNGFIGLVLVLLLLSLFLEFKLAFWVTVGIPTSFLGAFLFLPFFDVTINMISLFAFIIALGIVVDDAIVAGENIYEYRQKGMGLVPAAVQGARDIAVPIIVSVLTNIVAFVPLALIPGSFGQLWAVIPIVVGTVFAISLIEALIILPAHLAYTGEGGRTRPGAWLHRGQQAVSRGFSRFISNVYGPVLRFAMHWRYVTLAAAMALLAVTLAYPLSGAMGFSLMPTVESDQAEVVAVLPQGTPDASMKRVRDTLVEAAEEVVADNGGAGLSRGIYAEIEGTQIEVVTYLEPADQRPIGTSAFARLWRERAGEIPGLESIRFHSDRGGPGGGAALTIGLSHRDTATLRRASSALAERLRELSYVTDVDDGYRLGSPQWNLRLTESGRALGLSANDLGGQVRAAFNGEEAFKLLRGGNEVTVRVQLPPAAVDSEAAVPSLMVRTPDGQRVPLEQVATIERDRALTRIRRENGRRMLQITADVVPMEQTNRVLAEVRESVLPGLVADFPGVSYDFGGRQESMQEALESFTTTVTLALLGVYALLAIPFRSYLQPLVVMTAIPFGIVGAILGHLIMGYSLSLVSVMGIIALGGMVVNGSLVMIDYANARLREGHAPFEAFYSAGVRRFRPIALTTMTTFGGLAPMIFETSVQARFMIPMALSLGYGIVFSSAILLFLIPCLAMALEDLRRLPGTRTAGHTAASGAH
ncbi:efflux RND transporter permease subunit [Aquisalimonas lutea]|uniref:efflux RND transporter permease subunit n=1 Tax=Aquisalimonas lutea TaxID=1327750 RepID=UPI0025B4E7F2|nr:efflux RND transporter permease subunit [Aquisalimonas lutea]MDN3518038.1 efflux RND transporter permease subunit [Aquisalimonas lutea]